MRHPIRNFWRLSLLALAAAGASACVVDPGYDYGYYGAPATVYASPAPYYYGGYYGYHGYCHGGYGYGYRHWR